MLFKSALIATVLATLASAQTVASAVSTNVAATTTASQVMPPSATAAFNPAPVNSTVRLTWCRAQLNTCPIICGGRYSQNSCDSNTLTYSCSCANGTTPDVTAFTETLPYYICQQTYIQCIANNPDNQAGQDVCTANERCGTRNATAEYEASQTRSSSASSSASRTSTSGSGTATSASATSASATSNAAAAFGAEIATGAFVAVFAAAFKLLL